MKKKITIAIAVLIIAFIGLNIIMEYNGYRWKGTDPPAMSNVVDGVEYRTAIMTIGYDKLVINIQDIERINKSYSEDEYLITDWQNKKYRVSISNVILSEGYLEDDKSVFDRD